MSIHDRIDNSCTQSENESIENLFVFLKHGRLAPVLAAGAILPHRKPAQVWTPKSWRYWLSFRASAYRAGARCSRNTRLKLTHSGQCGVCISFFTGCGCQSWEANCEQVYPFVCDSVCTLLCGLGSTAEA